VNFKNHDRPDLFIHPTAKIGKRVSLGMGVVIDDNVVIGDDCNIWHHVVIRSRVIIGDRVSISSGCVIEDTTSIGDDTRIAPQCHITGHAIIGKKVFFGPMVTTCNEKKIASHGRKIPQKLIGPTIHDGVRIGSAALIMPGAIIGEQAVIAAGSLVNGEVKARTIFVYRGNKDCYTYPVPEEELLP
jgi:UDP-2-acetamido-3-amino-2,3-dideoxy-glucuronate N-acetyltransferase